MEHGKYPDCPPAYAREHQVASKPKSRNGGAADKQPAAPQNSTGSSDADEQASRGRAEYGQVGGTRETATDEGGYSRDGRQGGFGENKPEAQAARRQDAPGKNLGRRSGTGDTRTGKK